MTGVRYLLDTHTLLIEDHRDPFDRLLIATAMEENAIILSADEKLNLYANLIKVIW